MLKTLKSDMDTFSDNIDFLREIGKTRQANKFALQLEQEQHFRDHLKEFAVTPDKPDELLLNFIETCEDEYGITSSGFPCRCSGENPFALRPEVILMCARIIRGAYFFSPWKSAHRHPAPRVRKDADFFSYAMKHRLEDWFQYLYGYVDPHNGYVSNGEACIVAMYFDRYNSNIMKVGKIPERCGRTPNIDVSYSRELKHFFDEEPYFFKL